MLNICALYKVSQGEIMRPDKLSGRHYRMIPINNSFLKQIKIVKDKTDIGFRDVVKYKQRAGDTHIKHHTREILRELPIFLLFIFI